MNKGLRLDLSKVEPYAKQHELDYMEAMVNGAHNVLHEKTGAGNDF